MNDVIGNNSYVDVICQHTKNADIIPLRVRIQDEDGMFQTFSVKAYKELSHAKNYMSPYGTISHGHTWSFRCKIQVLDKLRELDLYYNAYDNLWKIVKIQ